MNEDTIFFQKLFHGEMGYVSKCDYIEVNNNVRIYYKKHNTNEIGIKNGFNFCVVEFSSVEFHEKKKEDDWQDSTFKAIVLFHGISYYDGVRHLHMGDKRTDNENYLYYPGIETMIDVFKRLRGLEKKHCYEDMI